MSKVSKDILPKTAILRKFDTVDGAYTDCFSAVSSNKVSLKAFVETFYTGRLFCLERWILGTFLKKTSCDSQLAAMLDGHSETFSAWSVEERGENQLLMCDYQNRTRSWFMIEPIVGGTKLYFGSAVIRALKNSRSEHGASLIFRSLFWFHDIYSRLLLGSAARRL